MGPENIWLVGLGGLATLVYAVLYAMGGTSPFSKALRRYLGTAVLAGAANLIALYLQVWQWQYLLMYPILIIGTSMGYGSDTTIGKIIKRTICALSILGACVMGLWATGFTPSGWVVMGAATLVGLTSVVFGVKNPWNNAPLEQYIIAQVLGLFVPWWAFVK